MPVVTGRASIASRLYQATLFLVWLAVAAWALQYGLPYYSMPLQERAYAALHDALKPTGTIGLSYGAIGSIMMFVGVAMYAFRKRMSVLRRAGKLKHWLSFHIFLCTLGPFLVLLHTSFKVGGLVSIAFWSMVIVVVSGVFGRYVYARIPKTLNGQFLSLQAVEEERAELHEELTRHSGLSAAEIDRLRAGLVRRLPPGLLRAITASIWFDLTKGVRARRVQRALAAQRVPRELRRAATALFMDEASTAYRMALLAPFRVLFGYWHLLHLPLAIVMLLIALVHIGVAVAFGYRWIF